MGRDSNPRVNAEEMADFHRRSAESGAVGDVQGPHDSDLPFLVDVWPTLSGPVKAGIMALVRAAGTAN